MTNFNENKYNFWKLIKKYKIVIPMIQRDYVQGRKDKKVNEIRKNLIDNIKLALDGKKELDFDFIYGSTKEKDNGIKELSLLDGQQRITTLFLLHLYFAKKENEKLDEDTKNIFHNFSYQNRVTSREFCRSLVDEEFKITEDKNISISETIKQKTWYYSEWNNDPTVKNMLNMLDYIHEIFYEYKVFDKLINEDIISFIFIPLEKFNLTDELYIKMNSRGKRLTNFEIFKSKIIEILKQQNEKELLEEFSRQIETDWADLFFQYRKKDDQTYDEIFMRYLYFITEMIYATKINEKTQKDSQKDSPFEYSKEGLDLDLKLIEETYKSVDNIKLLIDILNLWKNKEEITEDMDNAFSLEYSDKKVMLFEQKENINLFEKCIYCDNFGLFEKIMLYALLLKKINKKIDTNNEDLRIIRNFILNIRWFAKLQASYESNIRYYMLKNFFMIFENIIKSEDPYKYILNENFYIGKEYMASEIKKAELISKTTELSSKLTEVIDNESELIDKKAELKKIIFKCEDNNLFRGNIENIIDLIENSEDEISNTNSGNINVCSNLMENNENKVVRFVSLLNENSNYQLLFRTMLSFDDYGIFVGGSIQGNRFFYGSTSSIYDILTYNNDKNIQNKIKTILKNIFEKVKDRNDDIEILFNDIILENISSLPKNNWRYNVVKYPEIWEMSFERIYNSNEEITYIFALNENWMNISAFSKRSTNSRHINPFYKPILKQYDIIKQNECYSTKDDNGEIILNNNVIIRIDNNNFIISSHKKQEELKNIFKLEKINQQGDILINYDDKYDYVEQLKQIVDKVKLI